MSVGASFLIFLSFEIIVSDFEPLVIATYRFLGVKFLVIHDNGVVKLKPLDK